MNGDRTINLTWTHQLNYAPSTDPSLVAVDMPWVQVVTWNDWPEGTTVEPAEPGSVAAGPTGNGYEDLLLCREHALTFKSLSDGGAGAADGGLSVVQVPLWILEARSAGHDDLADQSVTLLARGLYANATMVANSWRQDEDCSATLLAQSTDCETCACLNSAANTIHPAKLLAIFVPLVLRLFA